MVIPSVQKYFSRIRKRNVDAAHLVFFNMNYFDYEFLKNHIEVLTNCIPPVTHVDYFRYRSASLVGSQICILAR